MTSNTLPRLLRGARVAADLGQHEETFAFAARRASMLEELDASACAVVAGRASPRAQGRLLRDQRNHSKFVVVNAMEGEPASHKDARC